MSRDARRYFCPSCQRRTLSAAESRAGAPCGGCQDAAQIVAQATAYNARRGGELSEGEIGRIRGAEAATTALLVG